MINLSNYNRFLLSDKHVGSQCQFNITETEKISGYCTQWGSCRLKDSVFYSKVIIFIQFSLFKFVMFSIKTADTKIILELHTNFSMWI